MLLPSLNQTCSRILVFLSPKRKKLSYHGRYSGGVIVLVRKDFVPFVERIYLDVDNIVVLRIKKVLVGTDKDVMFISAYLPPYDSSYWKQTPHGYGMEIIEKCVMDLHDKTDNFYLLLCGDLNARTASENYSQVQDDYEDVLSKVVNSSLGNHKIIIRMFLVNS